MNIIKVKEQGNSLSVTFDNGSQVSCPKVNSNIEYEMVKEWQKIEGNLIEPEFTEAEMEAQAELRYTQLAEKEKLEALSNLTVTTSTGKVFYANTESRVDLNDAIRKAEKEHLSSTYWKLAKEFEGQRIVSVTLEEIIEASDLALVAKGTIVGAVKGELK